MARRTDTFDEYREKQKLARISNIQSALKIISNSSYSNITRLAKDVSKVVTEIELKNYEALPLAERPKEIKPVSHVTLLRNAEYRALLKDSLNISEKDCVAVTISSSDFEALKIRNAGLEAKVSLLKQTIINLDAGNLPTDSDQSVKLEEKVEYLRDNVRFLLRLIDDMNNDVPGVFVTVLDGEEDPRYSEPGFYGPMNLIATLEELKDLEKLRDEVGMSIRSR
ncbi:hypothetical protein [Pseudomonas sp. Irchel s3b5]|uniref:hypothetical protein n=1 Tax=Pseudomonas sp. Irchel s3b5 TaxID=2009077 RepID=UPI000BA4DB5F|nr:hypothetical protein [Pseudomonas sp. Irchel s3b5]